MSLEALASVCARGDGPAVHRCPRCRRALCEPCRRGGWVRQLRTLLTGSPAWCVDCREMAQLRNYLILLATFAVVGGTMAAASGFLGGLSVPTGLLGFAAVAAARRVVLQRRIAAPPHPMTLPAARVLGRQLKE